MKIWQLFSVGCIRYNIVKTQWACGGNRSRLRSGLLETAKSFVCERETVYALCNVRCKAARLDLYVKTAVTINCRGVLFGKIVKMLKFKKTP